MTPRYSKRLLSGEYTGDSPLPDSEYRGSLDFPVMNTPGIPGTSNRIG
jgi:hypothetical protein